MSEPTDEPAEPTPYEPPPRPEPAPDPEMMDTVLGSGAKQDRQEYDK